MSILLNFKTPGFTVAKYEEATKQLRAAGVGAPEGRGYHVCYGDPNGVSVTDVWDNIEDFKAFGQILIPILQSLGVDIAQPDVQEVHNIVLG